MKFLKLELGILLIVLAESVLDSLLQLVFDVGTHVSDFNLSLLGNLVALLDQILTTLLCRLRDIQSDDLTIVLWGDAHIGIHDGLLDITDLLTVPRLDSDGTGIGHTDVGHLIEGHLTTIEFYSHTVEDGHISTACTNTAELLFQKHRSHLHALFTFLQSLFNV